MEAWNFSWIDECAVYREIGTSRLDQSEECISLSKNSPD